MCKAVLCINYTNYVMDVEDAVTVAKILGKAEMYKHVYNKEGSAIYIYPNKNDELATMKLISDSLYQMGKVADEPPASA